MKDSEENIPFIKDVDPHTEEVDMDIVYAEQVKRLYKSLPPGLLASLVCMIIMTYGLRTVVDRLEITLWAISMVIVLAFRFYSFLRFRSITIVPVTASFWRRIFFLGTVMSGIIWGSVGIVLYPDISFMHQMFITFFIGGLMAGSISIYSTVFLAVPAFIIPALVPVSIGFFMNGGEFSILLGGTVLFYAAGLIFVGKIINKMSTSWLKLQIQNAGLVSFLSKAKEQEEQLNKKLQEEIAERKQAYESLRKSESKFHLTFQNSPDAVIISRLENGVLLEVNDSFIDLTGFSKEEVIGKSSLALNLWIEPKRREEYMLELTKHGSIKNYEIDFQRKDGSTARALLSSTLIELDGSMCALTIARDITEIKNAELDNKKLEEQLFQAQKMESLGRLAGGIAHDFNNILSIIMGYADVLKQKLGDISTYEGKAADTIFRNVKRASDLSKQLLTLSRNVKYELIPIDINKEVLSTVRISEKIFEKNITVTFDMKKGVIPVEADGNKIGQVITNLIINAKDAMPHGGELTIKTELHNLDEANAKSLPDLTPGPYVAISVTDTGDGMDTSVKEQVFEPFFTNKSKGLGLGLATAYRIIKNHKGYIAVETAKGEGTTFVIYLPVTKKKIAKEKKMKKMVRGNETILVVNDEQHVNFLLKEMLEGMGYKVMQSFNGKEALDVVKNNSDELDFVLLDMVMPELSGYDTFFRLKNIKSDIRILIISGYARNTQVSDMLKHGACGFLQKPFEMHQLPERIAHVLAG